MMQAGGAINVGFDSFSAAGSCSAEEQATLSQVEVDQCLFQGNLATDHGGAIGVQSGSLQVTVCILCMPACLQMKGKGGLVVTGVHSGASGVARHPSLQPAWLAEAVCCSGACSPWLSACLSVKHSCPPAGA